MDNIPSVSVDVEGNISLRGNDNVSILINGKPSGLGFRGYARQLPAESIEKVEVTPSFCTLRSCRNRRNPNIILKREELAGFNGSFIANAGTPPLTVVQHR